MKKRLLTLPENYSFFLFGARNTGKSTLIKKLFENQEHMLIDLLNIKDEAPYLRDPGLLSREVLALPDSTTHVIIDEIQKIPALLNEVHSLIEKTNKVFILTGSSARKLKKGSANLLAGRAFVKHLYPFSFVELEQDFELLTSLNWGMLPTIWQLNNDQDRGDFLRAYTHTYLKEEVWAEHLVKQLEPFNLFLEVAAQCNGTCINASNIGRDVGVAPTTVTEYFDILVDTLIGFKLPAYQHSFRKRLTQAPKFYFFDTGVVKALKRTLQVPLTTSTHEYGSFFEHFIIAECIKLASYFYPDYRFYHFRTKSGVEIDLIVERPGQPLLMIEIKSSTELRADHLKHLQAINQDFPDEAEFICLADIPRAQKFNDITALPYRNGILRYFKPE